MKKHEGQFQIFNRAIRIVFRLHFGVAVAAFLRAPAYSHWCDREILLGYYNVTVQRFLKKVDCCDETTPITAVAQSQHDLEKTLIENEQAHSMPLDKQTL